MVNEAYWIMMQNNRYRYSYIAGLSRLFFIYEQISHAGSYKTGAF